MKLHPAHTEFAQSAAREGTSVLDNLEGAFLKRSAELSDVAFVARDLHVLPDFLGNRSPFADPEAKAVLAGLALDGSSDSLAALYVAGLCGLGYVSAQILDTLAAAGYRLKTIVASGGAARSPLVRQISADATGLCIVVPETPEPVLLGAAMLGAVAAGAYATLSDAMQAMSRDSEVVRPAGGHVAAFHDAKRTVFEDMQALDRRARETMGIQHLLITLL